MLARAQLRRKIEERYRMNLMIRAQKRIARNYRLYLDMKGVTQALLLCVTCAQLCSFVSVADGGVCVPPSLLCCLVVWLFGSYSRQKRLKHVKALMERRARRAFAMLADLARAKAHKNHLSRLAPCIQAAWRGWYTRNVSHSLLYQHVQVRLCSCSAVVAGTVADGVVPAVLGVVRPTARTS